MSLKPLIIYVCMMTGESFKYEINSNATIMDIKQLIKRDNMMHPSVHIQRLMFRPLLIELCNLATLADCGIINDSVLDLLIDELPPFDFKTISRVVVLNRNKNIEELVELLSQHQGELNLNAISGPCIIPLCRALEQNDTVTSLFLCENGIRGEAVLALDTMLRLNKTITNINLSGNTIEDVGANALASMLKLNKTITNINLYSNKIKKAGAIALAHMLKINKTITNINLRSSEFGDEGVIQLAEALCQNTSITNINLRDIKIGDIGAIQLAEALNQNRSITNIDLLQHKFSEVGLAALHDVCIYRPELNIVLSF